MSEPFFRILNPLKRGGWQVQTDIPNSRPQPQKTPARDRVPEKTVSIY